MATYTIEVAIHVNAETETQAAQIVSNYLDSIKVTDGDFFECWWLPNYPYIDNSDMDDPKLIWVPDEMYRLIQKFKNANGWK